ncbi:MAG: type II and III secretion system protein family protein [Sphingomonadaceae bacterium]|nr:type II and III secretion system protein family protein [Sphingomonadaceae bacterium]
MTFKQNLRHGALTTVIAAAIAASTFVATASPAQAQSMSAPANSLNLSVGRGQLVNLPRPMTDLFVANDGIADVQVRSSTALYVFAKAPGETTVYASDRGGNVVWSANVRVGNNIDSIDQMLRVAMPEAQIAATPMNGMVLLTGTVAEPADVEDAQRLVQAFVGEETEVVSRLRTATPLQVNLQVRIAEVNRSVVRDIGVNLLAQDMTGGFGFALTQGRANAFTRDEETGLINGMVGAVGATTIGGFGSLFGLDLGAALDLAEADGLVTTLAEPNLTALSGETASFLAGGEFPIPISEELGRVTIEYKQFGVSLAFSPTVLANGRISMRVRPEVSELSNEGAVELNDFEVPAITTRRAETTVELGSGQSFMIAGLMRNSHRNTIDRAPFLGSLPIIGALFRSNSFQRSETELVIIVTPYLVRPVSANQLALPTDGYRGMNDAETLGLGRTHGGYEAGPPPQPSMAPPTTVAPGIGPVSQAPSPAPAQQSGPAAPGFSFND